MSLGGDDRLNAVQVQANGAIVVGGTDGDEGFVARVTLGGTPDASFSGDGQRTGLPLTVAGAGRSSPTARSWSAGARPTTTSR